MSHDPYEVQRLNRAERALWRSWVWLETAISDRVKVLTAFVTIVGVDTYLTMWGVESGLVAEANPFMIGIAESGQWDLMLGMKFVVVSLVVLTLYLKEIKDKGSRILVNYMFLVGILVVLWNIGHIALALVFN